MVERERENCGNVSAMLMEVERTTRQELSVSSELSRGVDHQSTTSTG